MQIINVPVGQLKESDYNPRQINEKQFNDLKESIKRFGFVDPIVVNNHPERKNIIIGGHQRWRAAQALGIKEVPVYFVQFSLEKERELNLRLNKNLGEWDWDKLSNMDEVLLVEVGFDEDFVKGGIDSSIKGILENPKMNTEEVDNLPEYPAHGLPGERKSLTFWFDDDESFKKVADYFKIEGKNLFDTSKLLELIRRGQS